MQNSMMLFTFFVFEWKYLFWANLVQKNQNFHFKLKFGTYTNSNMQNSMVMFIFLVFDRKYPFLANLVEKVKIISWSLNLVARLIQICWIQWCCSLFSFLIGRALLGQIWSKLSISTVFFCFRSEMLFVGKIWSKMSKLSV